MSLRISLVHYLNAAPLGWFFLHGPARHRFRILPASPAGCAEQLARGEADIGLIPTIEYQRIPNLHVIPDVAIAASNEVRSVLLVRPYGVASIRSVALDTSSRTSVALVKLLLQSRMGIQPEFVPHEPSVAEMLRRCDAALIIGDAALRCSTDQYQIMDLAAAWRDWQGRPFVFAFWACRPEVLPSDGLAEIFQEARDWGLERIGEIAASYSRTLSLPAPFLEKYLQRNLDHTMGPEHIEGLDRFYRLAFEAGLIGRFTPVRFLARTEGRKHNF
ncbi:MAG: menaquinone biosynthesis protein [Acidobacteriia bacterium]|nr:menaquinone biosynthesis protein [Terriglobia bacterium]